MKIITTKIDGCYELLPQKLGDNRGFFSRLYCEEILKKINLKKKIVQVNTSFSKDAGTLRGMHYQKFPFQEDKIVFCVSGVIYDVVLDLRKNSKTFGKWISKYLDDKKNNALLIPQGCAHGFLTIKKNTKTLYFVTNFYNGKFEKGVRYDDPKFAIKWPKKIKNISKKDMSWESY